MKRTLVILLTICMSGLVAFAADTDKKEKRSRKTLLEKYDTNKDGKLDKSERQAMHKDRQAEALKKYDKNGDGKLDESERKAARADRRKAEDANKPAEANKSGDQPQKDK
jgi:Ca2+-binding EF-hand superfamily protein